MLAFRTIQRAWYVNRIHYMRSPSPRMSHQNLGIVLWLIVTLSSLV